MKLTKLNVLLALAIIAGLLGGLMAFAETTPSADSGTIDSTGTETYDYDVNYYALKLKSIEIFNAAVASSTCTVTRVRSGRTNTVATITIASGAGVHRETNDVYFFKGDDLVFTMDPLTNAEFEIVGEQMP